MIENKYELLEYNIYNVKTWVLTEEDGTVWFPLSEIFKYVFGIKFNVSQITKEQEKNTIRVRMTTPRKKLKNLKPEEQPKDVIILGNLWCIKNIMRRKIKLVEEPELKVRDIIIESFANHWGFKAIGKGTLTTRTPNWKQYSLIECIAIAGEKNKSLWQKCLECERYYPKTKNFYATQNVTCEKCLGREFKIRSEGAYGRIEEYLKKRERN